jgi:hypothetical protein
MTKILPFEGRWRAQFFIARDGGVSLFQEESEESELNLQTVTPLRRARARHLPSKGRIFANAQIAVRRGGAHFGAGTTNGTSASGMRRGACPGSIMISPGLAGIAVSGGAPI